MFLSNARYLKIRSKGSQPVINAEHLWNESLQWLSQGKQHKNVEQPKRANF